MMFFFFLDLTNNRKTSLYIYFQDLIIYIRFFSGATNWLFLHGIVFFYFLVEILHGIFIKSQKVLTSKYGGPPKVMTNVIHSHIDRLRWFISRKRAFEGSPPFSINIIQSIAFFAAVVVLLVDPFN